VNRQGIYRRLYEKRVDIVTSMDPTADSAFEEGQVTLANVFNGEERVIDDVSLFTFATPRVPNDSIAAELREAEVAFDLVGDVFAPRFVNTATADGYKAGMAV